MENKLTHFLSVDYRIASLNQIIVGLDNAIKVLEKQVDEIEWYDASFFYEESEPIYGLAFVAFQNYINGSINDLFDSPKNKSKYYNLESATDRTHIDLIIGLANYIKHKDDHGNLQKGTMDILKSFNLNIESSIEGSPIHEGLTILNKDWYLSDILEMVRNWRKKLFIIADNEQQLKRIT